MKTNKSIKIIENAITDINVILCRENFVSFCKTTNIAVYKLNNNKIIITLSDSKTITNIVLENSGGQDAIASFYVNKIIKNTLENYCKIKSVNFEYTTSEKSVNEQNDDFDIDL